MGLNDSYFHNDSKVIYVTENIPGPLRKDDPNSASLHEDFNSQLTRNCRCEDTNMCKIGDVMNTKGNCVCISVENGDNYIVNIAYGCERSSENILSTFSSENMENVNETQDKVHITNGIENNPNVKLKRDSEECNKPANYLTLNENRFNSKRIAIYECNDLCLCYGKPKPCYNRLVQYGPRDNLKIVDFSNKKCDPSQNKGLGLITQKHIEKGMFVCEYAGEVITKNQAIDRHKRNASENRMNYIICLNEYSGKSLLQTFVDPSEFGNIGRYMNHSCDPNCAIIPVRVDSPIPKLCLFALRKIECGEELTFDYGSHIVGEVSGHNAKGCKVCLCLSLKCKKFLPYHEYS